MKKGSDVYIKMFPEYFDEVMEEALYTEHYTLHKGVRKQGWVKDLDYQKRFHLYYKDGCIQLHLDKTLNGKHKAINWPTMLNIEARRIKKIYKSKLIPLKEKEKQLGRKIIVNQKAKNLKELQKFKTPAPIRKTWWQKLFSIFQF